jgi:hypothetical protein
VERVSKGAGSPGFVAFAAPLDTAFISPFDYAQDEFWPTRDAYRLSPEIFVVGVG